MTHLPANTTFSLHQKGTVWLIEQGIVNLFAIEKKNHTKTRLHSIATKIENRYLFSFDEEDPQFEIVAITETDVQIRELAISTEFSLFSDSWISLLSEAQKKEPDRKISHLLPEKGVSEIPKGSYFKSERGIDPAQKKAIHWIEILEGEVDLFNYSGPASLPPSAVYPVANNIWMHAATFVKVQVADTEEVAQRGLWQKGLQTYHRLFLTLLRFQKREQDHLDLRSLFQRKTKEEDSLEETLLEMSALLNPLEKVPLVSSDSLFSACQFIGAKIGVEFINPEPSMRFREESNTKERFIKEISEESQIRFRKVILNGNWQREDSGVLLAFYGPEEKPVVLLNEKGSGYRMVDPKTGETKKLTLMLVREIAPFAFYFYCPFPDLLTTGKELFLWVWKRNYKDHITLLTYGIIASLIGLFPPMAAAILFNLVIPNVEISLLIQVSLGLFIATISSALFFFFRSLILVRIQGLVGHQIWTAFWDRLLKLPSHFFHRFSSGNLYNMIESVDEIRQQLSSAGMQVILSGLFSFFYFFIMAIYSVKLTLIPLFLTLVTALLTWYASYFTLLIQKKYLDLRGQMSGSLVQILGAVSKFRTFGSESAAFSYWGAQFTEIKKLEMQAQRVQSVVIIANAILSILGPTLLFAIAIDQEMGGLIPTWVFLSFNAAFIPFTFSLFDLSNTVIDSISVFPLWKRAKTILAEPLEMTQKNDKPGRLTGDISLDRIVFRYGESSPLVLNDVSIRIRPKEFIAIVGPSGSGKSTLLRILLGFEQTQSGGVFFEEKDLRHLNLHEVRKQLGVVLQESSLISGSIFDNITCGGLFPKKDIENAIKISGFEAELEKFPMGLHTVVTSGGTTFSGGQKQKILIARALVGRPRILIFDEATSFLDSASQDQVSRSIDQLEITRIVVAHRLSTIRRAERIYVLDQGKIIQTGNFESLANEKGMFQNMLRRQQI